MGPIDAATEWVGSLRVFALFSCVLFLISEFSIIGWWTFPPGNSKLLGCSGHLGNRSVMLTRQRGEGASSSLLRLGDEDQVVEVKVQVEGEEGRSRPRGLLTLWRMVGKLGK